MLGPDRDRGGSRWGVSNEAVHFESIRTTRMSDYLTPQYPSPRIQGMQRTYTVPVEILAPHGRPRSIASFMPAPEEMLIDCASGRVVYLLTRLVRRRRWTSLS